MNVWQILITQMLLHLVLISSSLLLISVISNYLYERTYHQPVFQFVLNVLANFFSVTGTLILLVAFIAAAIEGVGVYMLGISVLIVFGFIISIKVYKGD